MIVGLSRKAPLEITPSSVLAMWAAGLALASAAIARWRVVGAGYGWLSGAITLLLGAPAAMAGGGVLVAVGCGLVAVGIPFASTGAIVPLFGLGGLALGLSAVADGGILATATGAVLLGGITSEMMLGHWFLVDPRLPRWALRRIGVVAGMGAVADLGAVAVAGAFPWEGPDLAVGVGYLVLAVTTMVLIAAVWASLGEQGYQAVMAATGLSYLAVLTAIGAAVLGRLLAGGSVLG